MSSSLVNPDEEAYCIQATHERQECGFGKQLGPSAPRSIVCAPYCRRTCAKWLEEMLRLQLPLSVQVMPSSGTELRMAEVHEIEFLMRFKLAGGQLSQILMGHFQPPAILTDARSETVSLSKFANILCQALTSDPRSALIVSIKAENPFERLPPGQRLHLVNFPQSRTNTFLMEDNRKWSSSSSDSPLLTFVSPELSLHYPLQ